MKTTSARIVLLCCLLCPLAAPALDRATPPPARLVNGTPTDDFPAVGILLVGGEFCTATLIGCQTVLTAAHCVCDPSTDNFAQCQQHNGGPDPSQMFFLPQYAPTVGVSSVTVNPDYNFGVAGDVAIIKLQEPVTGITPMSINTNRKPAVGMSGALVGFGRTGGNPNTTPAVGIKRTGAIMTATCPGPVPGDPGIPSATHVCVEVLNNTDVGTCQGDSGGPLLIDFGQGDVIAGITSGGASTHQVEDCLPDSLSFFTDVFVYRDFVAAQLGSDTGQCGSLPPVGSPQTQVHTASGNLSGGLPRFTTTVEVPAGAQDLRVNMNGEFLTAAGPNDFDLFVNFGAPASASQNVCADINNVAYGACEIASPAAGTWNITVQRITGSGAFQLIDTTFGPRAAGCPGDCDGNGVVRIDELVRAVNIALGDPVSGCAAIDTNGDGAASINELIAAVNATLNGCA